MAVRELNYNSHLYSISYEIVNPSCLKSIVFLHGWGSNKEIMKQAFSSHLKDFKHIYIDLPGFGASSIDSVIDTKDYKNIIELFLNSLHVEPYFVCGHSFGGKIASLMNPKNLVLLSSAGILVPKSFEVRIKIKFFKLFKNIVPKNMYSLFASSDVSGMSQTMYEVLKKVVDEDFSDIFKNINSKTYIFWGKNDSATPLSSGKAISKLIKNSAFYPLDGDHFFFIKNSKFIADKLERL